MAHTTEIVKVNFQNSWIKILKQHHQEFVFLTYVISWFLIPLFIGFVLKDSLPI